MQGMATGLLLGLLVALPETSRYALYVEAGGAGLIASLNGEYRIHPMLSARGGFAYGLLAAGTVFSLNVLLPGASAHHLEEGVGITLIEAASFFGGESVSIALPHVHLGYRYQPLRGGWLFRATLILFWLEKERLQARWGEPRTVRVMEPWAGVSVGYAFR